MQINVIQTIHRGYKLKTKEGKEIWCPILHEILPDICFTCGNLGYTFRECQKQGNMSSKLHEFGEWRKATWVKMEGVLQVRICGERT